MVYTIDEGPRVKIASVNFSGNDSLKTSALKNTIKTKTTKWFFWPAFFVEEVPAEDVARLVNIYHDRGFLDYDIKPKMDFADGKVDITFEINEGPSYTVGKV